MVTITVTSKRLAGSDIDDELTGIAQIGTGQIHVFAGAGDDLIVLDFAENITRFSHGHHARGDADGSSNRGRDTFEFRNIENISSGQTIVGRLEDFDSRDRILIDGREIDFAKLPSNVRIVEFNGAHNDQGTYPQQWIVITNSLGGRLFYAMEGARIDMDGDGGANSGDMESHFIQEYDLPNFAMLKDVDFADAKNYVPAGFEPKGGIIINDYDRTASDVVAEIKGSAKGDLIAAGLNDDIVHAGNGADMVWGGSGHDTIRGGIGDDTLEGGFGDDRLIGNAGNDLLKGGKNDDFLSGGQGNDLQFGEYGDDILYGNKGNDTLDGGDGRDRLFGGNDDDRLVGGTGNDTVFGGSGNDTIIGGADQDKLIGGAGEDTLFGGFGDDTLAGETSQDRLYGGLGNDKLYGGFGNDTLIGEDGHDQLYGGIGSDGLFGGSGNDKLTGEAGMDRLHGGAGQDTLIGGGDADEFVFTATSQSASYIGGADVIADFLHGTDKIDLSAIDASSVLGGNNVFLFNALSPFGTAHGGEVYFEGFDNAGVTNDFTMVYVDTDDDAGAEMMLRLSGLHSLTAEDFVL